MATMRGTAPAPRMQGGGGALIGILTVAVAVLATLALLSYDVDPWGAIGLPLVLAVITVPLLLRSRLARVDGLGSVLVGGLGMHFVGALMKYISDFEWYGGVSDTVLYHRTGLEIAEQFRSGRIGVVDLIPSDQGTGFINELSGLVQAIIGSDILGTYMFFAWLGFLGMVALIAAARRAVPALQTRRYAILVLFLPSMLFWPSGIGKDAWMVLTLGVFCLGAAEIFTRSATGFLWLVLGGIGMTYVRPHVALLALAAFGTAVVLGRRSTLQDGGSGSPVFRGVGLLVLVIGFAFVVSQASGLIPGFSPDGGIDLQETLDTTTRNSSIGGSEIDAAVPNSPLDYPFAFLTVMFRPLLFEASNLTALLAAVESTVLLLLVVLWRKQVIVAVRRAFRESYLMMAGLYTLAFAFAWSSIGNLGIIVRQRTQVLPLLLLFLCIPAVAERVRNRQNERPASTENEFAED